jgi:tRNA(adenine34) deaminase
MDTVQIRDEYYMRCALDEARKALAIGEFPVGCVVARGDELVAGGSRQNSIGAVNELDHAEIVALRKVKIQHPEMDLRTVTIYSTMEPCLMCCATLIVNGIQRVVYAYEDAMGGGTNLPLRQLAPLYVAHPFEVVGGILRQESLQLFQIFFRDPHYTYLRDTFLAHYTLSQP